MDQILKYSGIITGVFIYFGVLHHVIFFYLFGVEILHYVDFSETILFFIKITPILISYLTGIVLVQLIFYRTKSFKSDKKAIQNLSKPKFTIRLSNLFYLSITILFLATTLGIFLWSSKGGYIYLIICLMVYFLWFFFTIILVEIRYKMIFLKKNHHDKLYFLTNLIILSSLITISYTIIEVNDNFKNKSGKKFELVTVDGSKLKSTKDFVIIGETKGYLIFFNYSKEESTIVSRSEIKQLSFNGN